MHQDDYFLGEVIGSSNSYHRPGCHVVRNIKRHNHKRLRSWEEAVFLGLRPCPHCRPYHPPEQLPVPATGRLSAVNSPYVHPSRINELKAFRAGKFDLTKLIELCEELNVADERDLVLAVGMLARAILDHVPPIFGFRTFQEVANNYSGGKSFKDAMTHLENTSRKIADSFLHTTIRSKEALPTKTQVDFRNGMDMLLQELVRLLK